MEVHTHSHTPRKKWSHYFWEFFMLFLAVFCGMLAEYKLEHIIEHQREKKYIRSLIKDLELDIGAMQRSQKLRRTQIIYFDSLRILLKDGYENKSNDLYFYARHITRAVNFQYHDRTIQQLKNSGNLRLIRNMSVADSITVYDNERMKNCLIQQQSESEMRQFVSYNLIGKIFESNTWNDMTDSTGKISKPDNNPSLLTKEPALLNEFSFKMVTLKGTFLATNRDITRTINYAQKLVEQLKKEYHLK
jgi:tRNA U55 pseudouridine synthase TruB